VQKKIKIIMNESDNTRLIEQLAHTPLDSFTPLFMFSGNSDITKARIYNEL